MDLRDIINEAYETAKSRGWHDSPTEFGEEIAMMHSELSEAIEEYRNGHGFTETYYKDDEPCGIPIELADVCIRIFDYCAANDIDLASAITEKMEYNKIRPYRHGGKIL